MRPCIFIDRDGTVSHEIGYVNHVSRFKIFPYTVEAIRLVNRSGFLAVLATNQAGVARGYFPESVIHEVHAQLEDTLRAGGARLDGLYCCMHHPSVGERPYRRDCDCRKPRPGLLHRAQKDLDIDLARSYVIGDRVNDVELAHAVGARAVLVKSGYGLGELVYNAPRWKRQPDIVAEDLLHAVRLILAEAEAEAGVA